MSGNRKQTWPACDLARTLLWSHCCDKSRVAGMRATVPHPHTPGSNSYCRISCNRTNDVGEAVFTRPRRGRIDEAEVRQGGGRGRLLEAEPACSRPRQGSQKTIKVIYHIGKIVWQLKTMLIFIHTIYDL